MKLLVFINNLFKKQPTVLLGRWNIVYCDKKIDKKIELNNEDHCGTCNNYYSHKRFNINKSIFYETM